MGQFFGLVIPQEIGGFSDPEIEDIESRNAGWGYCANYNSGPYDRHMTVYAYDLGISDIPADIRADAVVSEFFRSKAEIESNVDEALHDADEIMHVGDAPRFLCSRFSQIVPRGGKPMASNLYLGSWQNKFVKLRLSRSLIDFDEPELDEIALLWARHLWP